MLKIAMQSVLAVGLALGWALPASAQGAAAAGAAADVKQDAPVFAGSETILLWPNGAPGSEGKTGKEVYEPVTATRDYSRLYNVNQPSITVFLPPKEKATGAAVIVAPGGGHQFLCVDHEGANVCRWLTDHGIAGIMLKYRLAKDLAGNSTYKTDVESLADAQRAIRSVRSRAAEWGIRPDAVGIIGFSAGGLVAGLAATRYDAGNAQAAEAIDRMSCKPDFVGLLYPGIRNANLNVTKETPPAFLAAANDDATLPPDRVLAPFYIQLKQAGVSAELHIYAGGGHGFGVRPGLTIPAASWTAQFDAWLGDRGFLKKAQ